MNRKLETRPPLQLTAQTTTLPLLKSIIGVVPLFLPRKNWSFDSDKNNGVVCAHKQCEKIVREIITVSLSKKEKADLEKITCCCGVSQSEIIREAIHDYVFTRKFRCLRTRMQKKAKAQNVHEDGDVFARVS